MNYINLLDSLVAVITAMPAEERGKAINRACQALHDIEHKYGCVEGAPSGGSVMLDDLDRDTLKRFHRHPREHWMEGAVVGKLLEGVPLGAAEREVLECFAGRQQEKWPKTCEALLRMLAV